jgi:hypothetical protein
MISAKPAIRKLVLEACRSPRRYLAGLVGPWLGAPVRFMVLSTPRTGSELLVLLLDAHPKIKCDSQILAQEVLFPRSFVEGRAVRARFEGAHAYGFKLRVGDIGDVQRLGDAQAFLADFARRGHKIFRLRRRNLLKQVLSFARAKQSSVHHVSVGETRALPDRLEVDPADVLTGLVLTERAERLVDQTLGDVPHTRLVYEDHLADPEAQQRTLDRIFRELGVGSFTILPRLVVTSPTHMRDAILNYEAVAAAVRETRFASYLE